jgi:adenine C2-methylase RlmN of 23S rRNA A2503 and tRNA A37
MALSKASIHHEMTTSQEVCEELSQESFISILHLEDRRSQDGTKKFLFELEMKPIGSVLILTRPYAISHGQDVHSDAGSA